MPGASRSGLAKPSRVGPVAEKAGIVSSDQSPAVPIAVIGAHSDDVGVVARHGDRLCFRARIAGGGQNDNAAGPGRLDRPIERVDKIGRGGIGAQAEVHDTHVEVVFVGHRILDALDDVGVGARAIIAQHT